MPHFRNFHGAAFDFAPIEPAEASNEKGLLVDFTITGARLGDDPADLGGGLDSDGELVQAVTDSFEFKDAPDTLGAADNGPDENPQEVFIEFMENTGDEPTTTPVFEDGLIIGANVDPMVDDFLF